MEIAISAEKLFSVYGFPITNSFISTLIVLVLWSVLAIVLGRKYTRLPGKMQSVIEMVYQMFDDMAVGVGGEGARKFVPLIVTFFLFIITANWLGVLPGVGSIGFYEMKEGHRAFVPLLRGANADINTTLALALMSVGAAQYFGIKASGIAGHLKHFKNPLEIVSELSKILSFSFRLFGNVFAGEVLLAAAASILVLVTGKHNVLYSIPGGLMQTPFLMLEVFVGFIQAFIFSVLTLVFISMFTMHHE